MIRHIESFGPEFYRLPLRHPEFSGQAHIDSNESWPFNLGRIAPNTIRRTREGCRVKPSIDALVRQVRIGQHLVRAINTKPGAQ